MNEFLNKNTEIDYAEIIDKLEESRESFLNSRRDYKFFSKFSLESSNLKRKRIDSSRSIPKFLSPMQNGLRFLILH